MNERIKEIRLACNLSQDEFAAKLGYKTRGKIANIEYGKTIPDEEFVDLVCRTFGINKPWLKYGTGEMVKELGRSEEIAGFVGRILGDENSEFQRRFVAALAKLSVDEWAVLEKIAKDAAGINEET